MTDKWLESRLAKVTATPERHANNSDPLLSAVFDRPGDDPIDALTAAEMSKVYDDGAASIFDPVRDSLERGRFNIPEPAAPLAKRALTEGAPMEMFVRLSKVDEAQRLVYGIATSETPDRDGEILDYAASKPFFREWSDSVKKDSGGASLGNLREMHGSVVAGKLSQIVFNDAAKAIEVAAKVVDDGCWKKVLERCYVGFSIGGKYIRTTKDGNLTRFVASPSEISLVDRPSCPTAVFTLVKADGSTEVCKFNDRHGGTMTAEEHMAGLHRRHSNHFTETAQSHKTMAGHHEALAAHFKKTVDDEGTAAHKAHAALAEAHHDRAEKDSVLAAWHHNSMEECEKAVKAELAKGNAVAPTEISVVAPDRPNIRAVPRAGQPEIRLAVTPELSKLLGLNEEDMHQEEATLRK
jgi:hypothetical protein